jgi:hypothetical protein
MTTLLVVHLQGLAVMSLNVMIGRSVDTRTESASNSAPRRSSVQHSISRAGNKASCHSSSKVFSACVPWFEPVQQALDRTLHTQSDEPPNRRCYSSPLSRDAKRPGIGLVNDSQRSLMRACVVDETIDCSVLCLYPI